MLGSAGFTVKNLCDEYCGVLIIIFFLYIYICIIFVKALLQREIELELEKAQSREQRGSRHGHVVVFPVCTTWLKHSSFFVCLPLIAFNVLLLADFFSLTCSPTSTFSTCAFYQTPVSSPLLAPVSNFHGCCRGSFSLCFCLFSS